MRHVQSPDFVNVLPISPNAAICLMDGVIVNCTNLPHISAITYSYSKMLVWSAFFWLAARFSRSSQGFARLAFSDTDSIFLSHQRPSTQLELLEKRILLLNKKTIPYDRSTVAHFLATQFLGCVGPILDWSSIINDDSYIYKTILRDSPPHLTMARFLVDHTRNQPFRMKCEGSGQALRTLLAPSAKQHLLTSFLPDQSYPTASSEARLLCKKVKGKQQHFFHVSIWDLSVCPSVRSSVCQSVRQSVRPSVHL